MAAAAGMFDMFNTFHDMRLCMEREHLCSASVGVRATLKQSSRILSTSGSDSCCLMQSRAPGLGARHIWVRP